MADGEIILNKREKRRKDSACRKTEIPETPKDKEEKNFQGRS